MALEVGQALEMGFAVASENVVFVPNEFFPQIRRRGLRLTEMATEWAPILLKIERANDIGRPEFKYRYSFLFESRPIDFTRSGYFGTISGDSKIYRLDDQTFALVSEMDRFNALLPVEKGRSESWLAFSKVKECAIDVGARLDSYLLSNDVIVPQQLNLEVHTWPDGSISFAPQVSGIEGTSLKKAFFNSPRAQDFYSVDGPNQSRVRVVFDERQAEALGRMKDVHHARGSEKERFLENPEAVFEGLLDVVEVRYGRRVTGIGSIAVLAQGPIARSRSVLETGLTDQGRRSGQSNVLLSDASGEIIDVSLPTTAEKQDLIGSALDALDTGTPTFTFEGREYKVDENIKSYIAEQTTLASKPEGLPKSQKTDAYLLSYQDDEDLKSWDVKDAEEARRACEAPIGYVLPSALQPNVILKTHQLEGLAWLQTCHRLRPSRRGSLLADDMGLGKTLQILSYLAWCIEHDRDLGLSTSRPPWRPILVVLPLILLESNTWENEIGARFRAGIFDPILILHGDKIKELRRGKTTGKETSIGKPLISPSEFAKYRVVITNYQTLTNYQHSFAQLIPDTQRSIWSVLITDEAQEYKSPSTKISHALKALHPDVHIACTGTPVENRLLDLWNLIDTVQPALLGTSKGFITKYEQAAGDSSERLLELKQSLLFNTANAFVLRRNKSEVLKDLPPKTFEPLYSEMTEWEIRMHQELLNSVDGGSPLKILHKLVALYQHPSLLREDGGALDARKLLGESSKLRAVIELLKSIKRRGEKCVIFAYRISMQQILSTVIEHEYGLQVDIVNGSTEKSGGVDAGSLGSQQARRTRNAMLERFRNTRGFNVIILSPFVASIGLTITEANHVIHYGRWWNPAVEAQATDRVYRIGQTKAVHVHLPILRDTQGRLPKSFDQNLHELIQEKQLQAENFLSPLPEESRIGEELFGKLKGEAPTQDLTEPIIAETVDKLPHHLFEALIALLLEKQNYKTILTARSNDGGADAIAFREGELWLVQAKHTKKDGLVNSVAMGDLMAAAQTYAKPLSYSLHLLAVTNGNFSADTRNEAARNGIRLLDRHKLMADLRTNPVTLGAVYAREDDRCSSFADGVSAANRWFE
ncbi:SNF2-related protein [Tunturiibacter gelidoferens]|uniref:Helicase n=1 Tax=Tunturiibacter lichenicola TaxID=2051959 RepID=A0A7Y9T720_9BACT|nr:SNF2-related protein [Edaphobacter lichenicola]NYF53909.1 hypothetical protein [Edaphobacter lichenicola]